MNTLISYITWELAYYGVIVGMNLEHSCITPAIETPHSLSLRCSLGRRTGGNQLAGWFFTRVNKFPKPKPNEIMAKIFKMDSFITNDTKKVRRYGAQVRRYGAQVRRYGGDEEIWSPGEEIRRRRGDMEAIWRSVQCKQKQRAQRRNVH